MDENKFIKMPGDAGNIDDMPEAILKDIKDSIIAWAFGTAKIDEHGWDVDGYCKVDIDPKTGNTLFSKLVLDNGEVKVAVFHLEKDRVDQWLKEL